MKYSCRGFPLTLTPRDSLPAGGRSLSATTSPVTEPSTANSPTAEATDFPARVGVLAWATETDAPHDPRSAYVETFWLPLLGPSTTLLLRRLADGFDASPDGYECDTMALSREIGRGPRLNRKAPFVRTIDRCVKFGMADLSGDVLHVRRRLPMVSPRQLDRLSERLQRLHSEWTLRPEDDGAQRRTELVRAAHLARTLLALGESPATIERQLHRWHFPSGIAWHATQWAMTDDDLQVSTPS